MFSPNEILVRYYTDCRQHATQVLNVILPRVFRKQRSLIPEQARPLDLGRLTLQEPVAFSKKSVKYR